ncbi:flagellar transcriptional regulator FlhD [Cupriavidus metallidurans]|uniref:flagellar transcriptional regulator FlhD n=1 Tax=Cupriavidus metallidurans TaxID=119219 RepID=UPI000B209A55|nr:flagellar transcriptional regulator FlhD [Cupriavidus metallidurans]
MIPNPSILAEIREMNTSYLRLVQKLVAIDRATALSTLGMADDIADALVRLSPAQLDKLATSNMVLCRIQLDGPLLLRLLCAPLVADRHAGHVAAVLCQN